MNSLEWILLHSPISVWWYVCALRKSHLGGTSGKEPACQHTGDVRDAGLIPESGRRAWQPTPVFLPGESPWTEEPGRLQHIGLHRVRHD